MLAPANLGPPGKMATKMESERFPTMLTLWTFCIHVCQIAKQHTDYCLHFSWQDDALVQDFAARHQRQKTLEAHRHQFHHLTSHSAPNYESSPTHSKNICSYPLIRLNAFHLGQTQHQSTNVYSHPSTNNNWIIGISIFVKIIELYTLQNLQLQQKAQKQLKS